MNKENKQKKNKINAIWWAYYTGRFISPEEVDEFEFACIGMSKSSRGPEVPIGTKVTIKDCKRFRCLCGYAEKLLSLKEELASQVKDKKEKKELISIARRIVEGEPNGENIEYSKESEHNRADASSESEDTGGREQTIKKEIKESGERKGKSNNTNEYEIDVENMLFGD